ncbi:NAD-glutamate dehydrogenase [Microbaculum marinisediminis]|uniref:NAD-glutamate dehydrogenase n=1 Tax=Microbaculum marinisediminis TaxID=2931392 RepID=A0AAW5QWD6_9HYPH|nr:NAD-glutamate dehydrogenase [Microbaculum sp. A6E488]MCT8972381.1 NAD-glutamate dehydrogenase [Microbaculum sp. A6E488]
MLQRDQDRRRALIEATLKALPGGARKSALGGFTDCLYSEAAYEDLAIYAPGELALLAEGTWNFTATRLPGKHKIRVFDPDPLDPAPESPLNSVTVVEIVNDNMPFLLDSAMAELQDRNYEVRLVLHPIMGVERDSRGRRRKFHGIERPSSRAEVLRESVIQIHVDRIDSDLERRELAAALGRVDDAVRIVVQDWQPMLARLKQEIEVYRSNPPPIPADEIAEAVQFLDWIADNNFTLLGLREYAFVGGVEEGRLERVSRDEGAGFGILRDPGVMVLRRGREWVTYTPELRDFLMQPVPLIVTKANVKSLVHRRVHMDYVGVKTFDDEGALTGELRLIGLFTSTAYNRGIRSIPYLRHKVDLVMRKTGFEPQSHNGKALMNVLETFPRDELFQIDIETLYEWSLAILQLGERPRIRVLYRADKFDRFVSALVYVPRDRYNTHVRLAIGDLLARAFEGRVSAFYPFYPEGVLTRVHFIIGRYEGTAPTPDQAGLEAQIAGLIRIWSDNLKEALDDAHDVFHAAELYHRYKDAFTGGYQAAYPAEVAVHDISVVERLVGERRLLIDFHRPDADRPDRLGLKLFRLDSPVPLSERVPILENMGFKVISERTYRIARPDADAVADIWMHDMVLERADGAAIDLDRLNGRLADGFLAVALGQAENDGYNALIVKAGLAWRDIATLRAYSRYLRQARIPYSQDYMWQTLQHHADIAGLLVDVFHARFSPQVTDRAERLAGEQAVVDRIEAALEAVPSLDEDRIVRCFVNLIRATLRTNFYQTDTHGEPREAFSIKLSSRQIDDLPEPRPHMEIFVYSPRVEGVHLRFGEIARGGLRWSDRPQDFRTEVLGLVKAQQVKNAVIVPVGAKGGFVPKHLPVGNREAMLAEGIACYKIFVGSLLDITDNLVEGAIVAPALTVRHDGDDPYLVVAADKGTATFSDIANGLSQAHDFWLDDAFASGGSAGYDHKKMGITARGAWEAVKRHFREMEVDIQTTPFSVIGVGDMSGDVFGNGMLLSEQIRLVAAFDHRDIFIDPDPDPAIGYAERTRLFALPRSSWQDYDASLISRGGGVFSRQMKAIPLSPQMQDLLGIHRKTATPSELISAILRLEADLLWFGGIGTYVRASEETDDHVGDRANDSIRITAAQMRVKVVGEGANLGMTQRARIEFALAGGRINSDAIDNSAGVNSSDMEVNIKIALGSEMRKGSLTLAQRNDLLVEMTEEVAGLVLRNNYLQTLALSLTERRGLEDLGFQQRLMRNLETHGDLDRAVEDLPDDAELQARETRCEPLTRPELAVLLAYAKIDLYSRLLDCAVPDDSYLGRELMRYFPEALQARFPGAIADHRLRREIISTMLANSMINRCGPTMIVRLADETGADVPEIAAAFAAARNAFGLTEVNGEIDALDSRISGALQLELYAGLQDLLLRATAWFLRNIDIEQGLAEVIDHYRKATAKLAKDLARIVPGEAAERIAARRDELVGAGLPESLATRAAGAQWLSRVPDIVLVSDRTGKSLSAVAETFFAFSAHFRVDELSETTRSLAAVDYYDRLALNRTLDLIHEAQRKLVAEVLATDKKGKPALDAWIATRGDSVRRTAGAIADIERGPMSLSRLAVAASLFNDLAGG